VSGPSGSKLTIDAGVGGQVLKPQIPEGQEFPQYLGKKSTNRAGPEGTSRSTVTTSLLFTEQVSWISGGKFVRLKRKGRRDY
jgi:hypothetical protein